MNIKDISIEQDVKAKSYSFKLELILPAGFKANRQEIFDNLAQPVVEQLQQMKINFNGEDGQLYQIPIKFGIYPGTNSEQGKPVNSYPVVFVNEVQYNNLVQQKKEEIYIESIPNYLDAKQTLLNKINVIENESITESRSKQDTKELIEIENILFQRWIEEEMDKVAEEENKVIQVEQPNKPTLYAPDGSQL